MASSSIEQRRVSNLSGSKVSAAHADARLGALADAQYGVIARRQIGEVGLTARMLQRRVESGHLVRLHRGVYAVGHRRLTNDGYWLGAVLACGPGALLSHQEAAALHGLLPPAAAARIHVTTAARAAAQPGIVLHARCALQHDDATAVAGIPVTTVARTLVDLAGTPRLPKALNEAERQGLFDARAVAAALARTRGRHDPRAATALNRQLAKLAEHDAQLTREVLEEALARLVEDHALPVPRTNAQIDGSEVDAVWFAARVAVEVDGWGAHRGRAAFQRDRTKTNALTLAGWTVLRFTWADVIHRPARTAAAIAAALAAGQRATG